MGRVGGAGSRGRGRAVLEERRGGRGGGGRVWADPPPPPMLGAKGAENFFWPKFFCAEGVGENFDRNWLDHLKGRRGGGSEGGGGGGDPPPMVVSRSSAALCRGEDLVADLKAHRTPGGCTTTSASALHIGWTCHM